MAESARTKCWTTQRLKNETARDLQKAIRAEAADDSGSVICVTCGARGQWNAFHAGHFISGRGNAILFEETNIHVQCVRCNNFLSGNQEAYTAFMVETYGQDHVDHLKQLRNEVKQFSRDELSDMREGYRQRWKIATSDL